MAMATINPPGQKSKPSKLDIAMKVLDSAAALGSLGTQIGGLVGGGAKGLGGLAWASGREAGMAKMGLPPWFARFSLVR